jgi:flagellar biosynthesis protein FlhB
MADTGGGDPDDERIEPDVDRAALIRAVAEDVRGDSSQSEQLAAILYRVSDLYDPDEETTPEEIYRNVVNILRIKERGTLERNP